MLLLHEIATMGMKGLSEYLRAMGDILGRNEQKDRNALQQRVYTALTSHGLTQWACAAGQHERKKTRK